VGLGISVAIESWPVNSESERGPGMAVVGAIKLRQLCLPNAAHHMGLTANSIDTVCNVMHHAR
jgi:hypothetical protein